MIQTVKLSLFEVNIVYQSFPIVPFTEVTFLARESLVDLSNAPGSRCLLSLKRQSRQVSGWFYLTQFRDSNGEIILLFLVFT